MQITDSRSNLVITKPTASKEIGFKHTLLDTPPDHIAEFQVATRAKYKSGFTGLPKAIVIGTRVFKWAGATKLENQHEIDWYRYSKADEPYNIGVH